MGISTDITITPGQTVSINGDGALGWAPRWGSGSFAVLARGSLSLTYIGLDPSASITLSSGGSLSVALMVVSVATLSAAISELGGAGSSLRFADVTVQEYHYDTAQTMAITINDDGSSRTHEGSLSFGRPVFSVGSGPCEISQDGQCVGRPQGYRGNEDCAIAVVGGGGTLASCSVFDIGNYEYGDYMTLPGDDFVDVSDCPAGAVLATGSTMAWTSGPRYQGNAGGVNDNGCAAKHLCGLPLNTGAGLGGGWEVCFTPPVPGCTNPTASDYNPSATVDDGSCTSGTPFRAGMKWEIWEGISGAAVSDLTSSPAYIAGTPTSTDFIAPPALLDLHAERQPGGRLTTYFLAPQSGDYTFVVSSDNGGQLWLGPDEFTLQLIVHSHFSRSGQWQVSTPQPLEAGSFYLLRAFMKNPIDAGFLAVGVTLPDGEILRPIPVLGYLFEPPPTVHG